MSQRYVVVAGLCILALVVACGQDEPTAPPPSPSMTLTPASLPPTSTPVPPSPSPSPTMTPTMTPALADPSSPLDDVAALAGLPLDEFFEASYAQLLFRDPERLTSLGLAEKYGRAHDQLTDISYAYEQQTQALEAAILDLLRAYNRDSLSRQQQISYDVYEWYLQDLLRGHEFTHHRYWVNSFAFLGEQNRLVDFFVGEHPVTNKQNAQDYVTRLSQIDVKLAQLLERVRLSEQAGVIPPRFIVELSIQQMRQRLGGNAVNVEARSLALYTAFEEKLAALGDLAAQEKRALLDAALLEIETRLVPAYVELLAYLEELLPRAPEASGAWTLPDGEAYYAYMLRQGTTTDLSADQIHALGLAEVARLQDEIRATAAELGYSTQDWVALWGQVYQDCDVVNLTAPGGQQAALDEFATLIDGARQASRAVLDLRAIPDVEVQPEPAGQGIGAYYSPAPDDGSRPPTFFISLSGSSACIPMMQRVAYHEAMPGHHLQIASAQLLDLPTFRRDMILNGYAEGWAVYAERLADELGLYADPISQLGYLRGQLYMAARVVMDTGLHSQGWTRQEAAAYVEDAMGMSPGAFLGAMDRYVAWPGQATGYTIGQLYMLELRQRATERLGDQFDLKEFHSVILDNGSVPLEILEQIVDDYIQQKLDT